MHTLSKDSVRKRNKNKDKRKQNKKVNSRSTVEESSYKHIGLNNNNPNKSFLLESSDTMNEDLIGLSKQRLRYPKTLILVHLNINSVRNKLLSFQQTVLNKIDIFLLSETKIDDSFPDSQFFAEGFKMYRKIGVELLIYVNKNLPGKIINDYKFKENSEIILFEFIVSNKKRLLLDNYNPPPTSPLTKWFLLYQQIKSCLDFFRPMYENLVLLGDFNMSTENPNLKNFM